VRASYEEAVAHRPDAFEPPEGWDGQAAERIVEALREPPPRADRAIAASA
jgi:hypothetical protein